MERNRVNNGVEFKAQKEFRNPAIVIIGDSSIVPCAGPGEAIPISLVPFKDHGRPAFIGSTIRSNSVLVGIANRLGEEGGQRLNDALTRTMESFLNNGSVRSDGVMKSDKNEKPDIHVLNVGNSFQDNGLRLYFHLSEYNGARVIIQDARTTVGNAERVDRVLKRDGGYQLPKGWENSKKNSGRN